MHSCGIPRWLLSRRWLKRLPSAAAACRATVSPLHDYCVVIAAPLCYTVALPRRSAALLLRYCRACCRTASLCCGRLAQLLLSYTPPPLCYCRAAPLHCRVAPLRAAPRHSATCCQLCTAPPRCCRAASLLPRRFATATPQRVLLSDSKTCLQMKTRDQNTVA